MELYEQIQILKAKQALIDLQIVKLEKQYAAELNSQQHAILNIYSRNVSEYTAI